MIRPHVWEIVDRLDAVVQKKYEGLTREGLISQLRRILANLWEKSTRQAMVETIEIVESGRGQFSQDEIALIDRRVAGFLGMDIEEAGRKQLIQIQSAAYRLGVVEGAALSAGVQVVWNLADRKALDILDRNLHFWIHSYHDDNLQEALKAIMQDYFEGGYNRRDLVDLFKQVFRDIEDKGEKYWNLLADHTVTKTREIGRVAGYERAGIRVVRIKAQIDAKTSEICRRMHNLVISTEDMREQVEGYFKACETKNKEKIKKAWPWLTDKQVQRKFRSRAAAGKVARAGNIPPPPYHAHCRTITVAEFLSRPGDYGGESFFDE